MRSILISSICLLTGCAGRAAAPPGQPSPAAVSTSGVPQATSIEETEAELSSEIRRGDPGPSRIVTLYHVNDRSAVDILIDWMRRQPEVVSVHLEDAVSRTRGGAAGSRSEGAAYLAEETQWEVAVEGPTQELGTGDVARWIRLLRTVPADSRWRLGPSTVVRSPVGARTPAAGTSGPRLAQDWTQSWQSDRSFSRTDRAGARVLARSNKWALGGGLVFGFLSAASANALCERSDGCAGPTVEWGLLGAAVGAGLGALIASGTD
jgi:hypothetical protein